MRLRWSGKSTSSFSSAAAARRSSSLSTVALPMCTILPTWSVMEGMSLLMACFTRLVATTKFSLTWTGDTGDTPGDTSGEEKEGHAGVAQDYTQQVALGSRFRLAGSALQGICCCCVRRPTTARMPPPPPAFF